MALDPVFIIDQIFGGLWTAFAWTWWFWLFLILAPLTTSAWLFWRREVYKEDIQWTLFELRIPRQIMKSPRAMEQVLGAVHSMRNAAGNLREFWWEGEIGRWFSMEMASFGGEVHLYFRFYKKYKALVEAAFFSYYPDVELTEVEDYVDRFPENIQEMYRQGYEAWGSEMVLAREEAYPIRTYADFEAVAEEKEYDPISAFLEILGRCKPEEMVGIQILITPKDPREWRDKWASMVEDITRSTQKKKAAALPSVTTKTEFLGGPLPVFTAEKKDPKEENNLFKSFMRSPGETDVLKAVENNLSKPAFDTLIRFVYFSPQPTFYDSFARRGLTGAFNQYGSLDLNRFEMNKKVSTKVELWESPFFPALRKALRAQRIIHNYKRRKNPITDFMGKLITSHIFNWNIHSRQFGMNTECLATLFHPPTKMVLTGPHLRRVESRKVGPPSGLAIFGEETDIKKYKE